MQILKQERPNINDKIDQFEGSVFLNVERQILRIPLKSIQYIKGYGDYMKVKCEEVSYTVCITMRSLEENLPPRDFYRLHKSYIIRLDQIEKVTTAHVQIGNTLIPIRRGCKQELLSLLPWIK